MWAGNSAGESGLYYVNNVIYSWSPNVVVCTKRGGPAESENLEV